MTNNVVNFQEYKDKYTEEQYIQLSLDEILDMDQDQFETFVESLDPSEYETLYGLLNSVIEQEQESYLINAANDTEDDFDIHIMLDDWDLDDE